jgi:hypothetical protein
MSYNCKNETSTTVFIIYSEFKCRLPDNASVFTAELIGIELAMSEIETTQGDDFVFNVFSTGIGRR